MPAQSLDQVVSLCKRRGFIFPGSEIYGGLANTWDYGPLGALLKNRVKKVWRKAFVHNRQDMVEIDASILMNSRTWEASGHVGSFSDPLIDCKQCHERFRGDKLIEERMQMAYPELLMHVMKIVGRGQFDMGGPTVWYELSEAYRRDASGFPLKALPILMKYNLHVVRNGLANEGVHADLIGGNGPIVCPRCGAHNWTDPRQFNLMFKTHQGVVEDEGGLVYMRPETAQGIFVNFKNILQTSNKQIPFGIAQIGKAFRNEITPGHFTFRTREFEQMEIEYFVDPAEWEKHFQVWQNDVWHWFVSIGIHKEHLRIREHEKDELSHYSSRTIDVEYKFPWGWGELCGLAYRKDFDLRQHQEYSGADMSYVDPEDPSKMFLPHVIEPSFGLDRTILTLLIDAYSEDEAPSAKGGMEKRTVLRLHPSLAPYDVAVLPLSKKEPLVAKAKEIYEMLLHQADLHVDFDITRSIGKRYRRQDEIGTPRCITVDFGTIGDDDTQCKKDHVTVRERDSLKQEEVGIEELPTMLASGVVRG